MRKVTIIGSASGNGKTTLGRALAERLDVPFVEMDALVHGPNWSETPDDELTCPGRADPRLGGLGDRRCRIAASSATCCSTQRDVVVWLDLPMRVWLPRLLRRTVRRVRGREELWNGNRETLANVLWGRESLLVVRRAVALPPPAGLSRGARGEARRSPENSGRGRALPRRNSRTWFSEPEPGSNAGHMRSGASTPTRSRLRAITRCVAAHSPSRNACSGSPSTRHAW